MLGICGTEVAQIKSASGWKFNGHRSLQQGGDPWLGLKNKLEKYKMDEEKGILRWKEWKWKTVPEYFARFRTVSSDNGEIKLGKRKELAMLRSKNEQAPVPKVQSSVPVWPQHPREHSTLPYRKGKSENMGQPNGHRKQKCSSTHQESLATSSQQAFSTLILTINPWILRISLFPLLGQYLQINHDSKTLSWRQDAVPSRALHPEGQLWGQHRGKKSSLS